MNVDLDDVEQAEKELKQLEDQYSELVADATLTAASMAPPPFGTVADVVSIGKSIWNGDWGGALLDVVGLIPVIGDAVKGSAKVAKIAAKMSEVANAIKVAHIKLIRKKNQLTGTKQLKKKTVNNEIKKASKKQCPKKSKHRKIQKKSYKDIQEKIRKKQEIRRKKNTALHREDLDKKYYKNYENGEIDWPKDNGFSQKSIPKTLKKGEVIDRYSSRAALRDNGSFLSPVGADFEERALPYNKLKMKYTKYRVIKNFDVASGEVVPAFGQAGKGTQYKSSMSVKKLLRNRFIEVVK